MFSSCHFQFVDDDQILPVLPSHDDDLDLDIPTFDTSKDENDLTNSILFDELGDKQTVAEEDVEKPLIKVGHKRSSYPVSFKLEVVEYSEIPGHTKNGTARKFGIDKKSVREWCRQKEELQKMINDGLGAMSMVRR